ncbi:hypothetical protein B0T17DRAFT_480835 [Bombardia bombarda]|uniref:DUF4238 domain-containing protein n=1 Tax=Bombardia bombarda TaxID=252184 RepID=A0AA39XMH4_9PEZI|nr:hypothetical protein B0T17DRAFT_480835 [Bombardia bombarda]
MATATLNTQYHHFVPQFLLRNFSHPYKPENDGSKKRKGGAKGRFKSGLFPKDPAIRHVDLVVDPPVICEKPVKRILGMMNMYHDSSKPVDQQHHVEKMFSKLESEASYVFRKITKAFEQHQASLWITRDERNLLRKFLFLLKYRGSGFHRRFYHNDPEEYEADDRELLHDYMTEKGYKRPMDVWFDNLRTIMELDMDIERRWIQELPKRMFSYDAMWFIMHAQSYYMAICTPENPDDEFILTDSSYNVFEGPNTFAQDEKTGEVGGTSHTPLHQFAPISPKLMIVLRSLLLPDPLEDGSEDVRQQRAFLRFMSIDSVYGPGNIKSLLADLPIQKAQNNYAQSVDGRVQLLSGENGTHRRDHRFCFTFFKVDRLHVDLINAILFDNCITCTSLVFESTANFARTLEWYLTAPCNIGKRILGEDVEAKRGTLKKLEHISRSLGSTKDTVSVELELPLIRDYEKYRLGHIEMSRYWIKLMNKKKTGNHEPRETSQPTLGNSHFMDIYHVLDGSMDTISADLEQGWLMWKLRVKIDAWSCGVEETIRERNRELLTEAYLKLYPSRVWLYIKTSRFIMLDQGKRIEDEGTYDSRQDADGPEDVIAKGESGPYSTYSYQRTDWL